MSKTLEVDDDAQLMVKKKQLELREKYKKEMYLIDISSMAIRIGINKIEDELKKNGQI